MRNIFKNNINKTGKLKSNFPEIHSCKADIKIIINRLLTNYPIYYEKLF